MPALVVDLVRRVHREGAQGLASELGPFVFVGSPDLDEDDAWSFATHSAVSPMDAAEGLGFDLDRSIVYALKKQVSTFPDTILVGRSRSNDIRIDHSTVSKLHARIKLAGELLWLEDAGSRNGTRVDGQLLGERTSVYPGDTVRFGSCSFRVHRTERFCDLLRRIRA